MQNESMPTFRWGFALTMGVCFLFGGIMLVSDQRRSALLVNGIELSPWWYLLATIPPALAVLAATAFPRSHRVWQGDFLSTALNLTILASLAHIPLLYVLGGFE